MDNYSRQLDGIFRALADPTRRAVIDRLADGPASITDLAQPFDMALPSFLKHIRVLEQSGLIQTRKVGRVRTCAISPQAFTAIESWLSVQRAAWESHADRLEQFVLSDTEEESS
jgi:DNA-binding transcriptional ArsR family regulator